MPNISSSNGNINQSINKSNGSISINVNSNINDISELNVFNRNSKNNSMNMRYIQAFKNGPRSSSLINIFKNRKKMSLKSTVNLQDFQKNSNISNESDDQYKPSFLEEKKSNYGNDMHHIRNFDYSLNFIRNQIFKIYGVPARLVELNAYNKDVKITFLTIIGKLELIRDNIDHFKAGLMLKRDFLDAFENMQKHQKAEFNCYLEEICSLIIVIMPLLFKKHFYLLESLIGIVIPNTDEEKEKNPENEIECLLFNYTFFINVSDYYTMCLEVFKTLDKKCTEFTYSIYEFGPLNSYLDVIRYYTTSMISMANSFMKKTKNDLKILDRLEEKLNIRKIKKKEIDSMERYLQRNRLKQSDEDIKIERINRALKLKSRIGRPEIVERKYFDKFKVNKKISAFNTSVFRDMMKYFKPHIKAQVIAQQVIDRYEEKTDTGNNDMIVYAK